MAERVLVRYGKIAEVARFRVGTCESVSRGEQVVVRSHRGVEIGILLEPVDSSSETVDHADDGDLVVLRPANEPDLVRSRELRSDCESEFATWVNRIQEWNLDLELIDLEWTLDRTKLVLYVLNNRGPDCTRLALQAAAAGLGIVEVQPVDSEGLAAPETGGGCGTGGCGCDSR